MSSRLLEIQTRIYNLLASWLPESNASGAEPAAPAQTILENQNRMYDLLAARFAQMPDEIADAVLQYLEDHPEALNQAAVEAILDGRLDGIEGDVSGLKSAVEELEAGSLSALGATAGQVPTADGNGSWEWATPSGGGGDVTDVQVNNVSVLNGQGVANIPMAVQDAGTLGVVAARRARGIGVRSDNGELYLVSAGTGDVKTGTNATFALVPGVQDSSTFYGLAKAAGSDEKNSNLPLGQYTDAAKSAIQTMLGISGIIAPVEDATASKAYAIGDAFLHGGALYKASAAIAAGDAIVPGTNCTQTTIIEMLKGA